MAWKFTYDNAWQEPSRSGVITMYEVDYQKQEPRYE